MITFLRAFCQDDGGATAVEYAVMLAAILLVVLVGVALVGQNTNALVEQSDVEMRAHGIGG